MKSLWLWSWLLVLFCAAPASAQYRNASDVVNAVSRDYPALVETCGDFVDQVAHRLNKQDGTDGTPAQRWGRKARQANGGNPNCDGLAYLNDLHDRTKKVLVDIIISSESPQATPAWQENLGDNVGNGFWTEPVKADRDAVASAPPALVTPDSAFIEALAADLAKLMADINAHSDANTAKIQAQIDQVVKNAEKSVGSAGLIKKIFSLGLAQ